MRLELRVNGEPCEVEVWEGESLLFASATLLGYALLLWVVAHLFVVFYEEPILRRKFGTTYETYRKTVPRWIPRHNLFPPDTDPAI